MRESKFCLLQYQHPLEKLVYSPCLLYTSDAADERSSVDLGGRRIINKKTEKKKKKKKEKTKKKKKNTTTWL